MLHYMLEKIHHATFHRNMRTTETTHQATLKRSFIFLLLRFFIESDHNPKRSAHTPNEEHFPKKSDCCYFAAVAF